MKGDAVRVAAPEIGSDVVVLRAEQYESIQELLADEREKAAWAKIGRKGAQRRLREDQVEQ